MSANSQARFAEIFLPLVSVQLLHLSAALKRAIPSSTELETTISAATKASLRKQKARNVLAVALKLEARGTHNATEIFQGECQLVGIWPIREGMEITEDNARELGNSGGEILYPLARQQLGELLGRFGLVTHPWPWHTEAFAVGETPREGSTPKKAAKSKKKRAKS